MILLLFGNNKRYNVKEMVILSIKLMIDSTSNLFWQKLSSDTDYTEVDILLSTKSREKMKRNKYRYKNQFSLV